MDLLTPSQTLAFTNRCLDHYPPWNHSHLGDLPLCPLSIYPPLCPLSLSFIYQLIVIFCNYGMFSLIILYFCIKSFFLLCVRILAKSLYENCQKTHLRKLRHVCWTFVLPLAFSYHVPRTSRTCVLDCSLSLIIRIWHLGGFLLSGPWTISVFCYVYIVTMPIFLGMRWRQRWDGLAWGCRVTHEHKGKGGCEGGILLPWPHSQTPSRLAHSLPWTCLLGNAVPELFASSHPPFIFDVIHLSKASFSPLSPCGSHFVAKSSPSLVLLKY